MGGWVDVGARADLESSSRLEADVDGYRVRVYVPFGKSM